MFARRLYSNSGDIGGGRTVSDELPVSAFFHRNATNQMTSYNQTPSSIVFTSRMTKVRRVDSAHPLAHDSRLFHWRLDENSLQMPSPCMDLES
jgi:hypothetical protein